MKKTYIFGQNSLAELLSYYLCSEKKKPVDGFVLNERYIGEKERDSVCQPVLSIESVLEAFGSENIAVYLPVAYAKMNGVRATIYSWLKQNGVEVLTYIHPSAELAENTVLGEGNIILEKVIIQPYVKMGSCNVLWNGTNISHHSSIGSFNWFAPSTTLSGRVVVGNRCFLGTGSIVRNDTRISDEVLVGAGAYVSKDLHEKSVFVPQRGCLLNKESNDIYLE